MLQFGERCLYWRVATFSVLIPKCFFIFFFIFYGKQLLSCSSIHVSGGRNKRVQETEVDSH